MTIDRLVGVVAVAMTATSLAAAATPTPPPPAPFTDAEVDRTVSALRDGGSWALDLDGSLVCEGRLSGLTDEQLWSFFWLRNELAPWPPDCSDPDVVVDLGPP